MAERTQPNLRILEPPSWQLPQVLRRYPPRLVWAAFLFINSFVSIALLSLLAMVTNSPYVFPSLGPTAILFFLTPNSPTASPRNAVLGHALGILCGYGALWVSGLQHVGPATIIGVDVRRVVAAALSLAATAALLILLKASHPPAGATTLIISLGVIARPWHLIVIELAVATLALQAILINRSAGIDYPMWAAQPGPRLNAPGEM